MVDYWKKYNKGNPGGFPEKLRNWFMGLSPIWKTLVIYLIAIIAMVTLLIIIPSPKGVITVNKTKIPSYKLPIVELPSPEEVFKIWSEFGVKKVKKIEYPITLEEMMCTYIYQYDLNTTSWGNTTCYRWQELGYDCLCITPVE
ncbi:MAG: hypothetical protein ACTSSP_07515 [Candidatus Asgardarchaeia archaeon]